MKYSLLPHTEKQIAESKKLTKDDLAYELQRIGALSLPFIALVTFKRKFLVEVFNSKFNTNIK